jgi:RNA polymerase sigma-70 factor, ECF subfamily
MSSVPAKFRAAAHSREVNRPESPVTSSDRELIEQLIRGDAAGWRAFIQSHGPAIRRAIERIVRRFPSMLCPSDAEDIYASFLHGLLARDMHKLRSFDAGRGASFATWMTRLASNAAWDHLRVVARMLSVSEAAVGSAPSLAPDPLSSLVVKESYERMQRTVEQLSSKDRTLLELIFLVGRSPEQIAHTMNISVKTVYSKKHKVQLRLQRAAREASHARRAPTASAV